MSISAATFMSNLSVSSLYSESEANNIIMCMASSIKLLTFCVSLTTNYTTVSREFEITANQDALRGDISVN